MPFRRFKSTKRRRPRSTKKVSKGTKDVVKNIIERMKPKNVIHNGFTPAAQLLGNQVVPVANFWQNIQSLTDIPQGNSEYQRSGDQCYVHRLRLRMYMNTLASNDAIRIAIMRQKSTGQTPAPINPNLSYQVVTPGIQGVISAVQDDKNVSILFDKIYTLGIAAGLQECRFVNVDLKFKNPLPLVFYDGTVSPTVLTTAVGNMALCITSVSGNASLYYQWDLTYSEK